LQHDEKNWIYPKKKDFTYAEGDPVKQEAFMAEIALIPPETIVYIDETGVNQQPYSYGWSAVGQKIPAKKMGIRLPRISVVAGQILGKLVAPFDFLGTCTRDLFVDWLKNRLLLRLKAGMTLVMDNARIHHGEAVAKVIQDAKCFLKFLPPYSPQCNPIENTWAVIKNITKKYIRDGVENHHDALRMALS
jgi:transposase